MNSKATPSKFADRNSAAASKWAQERKEKMERARILREQRKAGRGEGNDDGEIDWNRPLTPATPAQRPSEAGGAFTTPQPLSAPFAGFSDMDALDTHLQDTTIPVHREEPEDTAFSPPSGAISPGNDALTQHMGIESNSQMARTRSEDMSPSLPGRRAGNAATRTKPEWNSDLQEDAEYGEDQALGAGRYGGRGESSDGERGTRGGGSGGSSGGGDIPSRVGQRGKGGTGSSARKPPKPDWNSDIDTPAAAAEGPAGGAAQHQDRQDTHHTHQEDTPPPYQPQSGRRNVRPDFNCEMTESPLDKPPPPVSRTPASTGSKGGFLTLLKRRIARTPKEDGLAATVAGSSPGRPPHVIPAPKEAGELTSYPLETVTHIRGEQLTSTSTLDSMVVGARGGGAATGGGPGGFGEWAPSPSVEEQQPLSGCPSCGRTFNARALAIHSKSCGQTKQRKVFDMASQRRVEEDTQGPSTARSSAAPPPAGVKKRPPLRSSNAGASKPSGGGPGPGPGPEAPSSRPTSGRDQPNTKVGSRGAPPPPPPSSTFSSGGGGVMSVDDMPAKSSGGVNFHDPFAVANPFGEESQPPPNQALQQCGGCGRSFNPKAYQIHQKACKKVFQTKRKAFDVAAARAPDVPDAQQFIAQAKASARKENKKPAPGGAKRGAGGHDNRSAAAGGAAKPSWKAQSEAFRAAMRESAKIKKAIASGQDLRNLPPPPPTHDPSLVPCPHCGRRFNEQAAERHIPKCNDIKAKPKMLSRGGGSGAHVRSAAGGQSYSVAPPTSKPTASASARRQPQPVSGRRR